MSVLLTHFPKYEGPLLQNIIIVFPETKGSLSIAMDSDFRGTTFEYLPLKLAWGLRIHKAQGMNFEKQLFVQEN
jgi:hypothetical protein